MIGVGNVQYSDLLRVPLSTIDQSSYSIRRAGRRDPAEGHWLQTPPAGAQCDHRAQAGGPRIDGRVIRAETCTWPQCP